MIGTLKKWLMIKQQITTHVQASDNYAFRWMNPQTLLILQLYLFMWDVWEWILQSDRFLCSRDLPTTTTAVRGHFQNCGFALIVLMPIYLSMKSDLHKMLILLMCLPTSTLLNNYFHQKYEDNPWILDPFGIDMESVTLPSNKENQLVKLSCDKTLKTKFGDVSFPVLVPWCEFWVSVPHHSCNQNHPTIQHYISVWKWLLFLSPA